MASKGASSSRLGEVEIEDAFRLGAQADGDVLVAEQVLEQARVAIDRHPLEGVLEVAVVPGDEHGHARASPRDPLPRE